MHKIKSRVSPRKGSYTKPHHWKIRQAYCNAVIILAVLMIFVTIPMMWVHHTIMEKTNFTAVMEKVADDQDIRNELTAEGADLLAGEVDALLENISFGVFVQQLLPDREDIRVALSTAAKSKGFKNSWRFAVEQTHDQMMQALGEEPSGNKKIEVALKPIADYMSGSVYEGLSQKYPIIKQFIGGTALPTLDTFGNVTIGEENVVSMLQNIKHFYPIAILCTIIAIIIAVGAVVLSKKTWSAILVTGGGLIVTAAAWYGITSLGRGIISDKVDGNKLAHMFTNNVVAQFGENFNQWTASTMAIGVVLAAAGAVIRIAKRPRI